MTSVSLTGKTIQFFSNRRIQLLLIAVLTCIFYGNSIKNGFAFDDEQYYSRNRFVQQGVDGIGKLFTKESMVGFYGGKGSVNGGRWRPLTLITFALEKQYCDADPHVSHFINMLLYAMTGVIMLLFLRKYIFKSSPIAAFLTVLLFIIHPVHTEAVSHIKSRDELLSWLFLLLTLYCSLNFLIKKNYWQLILSLVFYFLALLSKENGVTFIVILPLTFYFFTQVKLRDTLLTTLLFAVIFGIYALIRFSLVPISSNVVIDITLAPYLCATPVEHIATELMVLGKYILLLFWPNPLSSDYSYNSIPYVNFSDWKVWLSVLIQIAFIAWALLKLKQKSLVSYGILFYFCSIFVVSNIVFDIGAILGERFLYQPSFGFCIAIVAAANEALQKINFKTMGQKTSIVSVFIMGIVVASTFQIIQRNTEWDNSEVLFTADVKKVPNSVLIHGSLGNMFLHKGDNALIMQERRADYTRALEEYDTANRIDSSYYSRWYQTGYLYSHMGNNNEAEKAYLKCLQLNPQDPDGYSAMGVCYYNERRYEQALTYYIKSAQLDSLNPLFYFQLGVCYHQLEQYENEIQCYKKTLSLNLIQNEMNDDSLLNMDHVRVNLVIAENLLQNEKK